MLVSEPVRCMKNIPISYERGNVVMVVQRNVYGMSHDQCSLGGDHAGMIRALNLVAYKFTSHKSVVGERRT